MTTRSRELAAEGHRSEDRRHRSASPSSEAALRVKRTVDANMADVIARETFLRGFDPKDFILFAFGGAGPDPLRRLRRRARHEDRWSCFPSRRSSAPGARRRCRSSTSTRRSRRLELLAPSTHGADDRPTQTFNEVVDELEAQAERTSRGEGYDPTTARFSLELDMKYGGQIHIHRAPSPKIAPRRPKRTCAESTTASSRVRGRVQPGERVPGGRRARSTASCCAPRCPKPAWELPAARSRGADASAARTRHARARSGTTLARASTRRRLRSGHAPPRAIARRPGDRRGRLHDDRRRSGLRRSRSMRAANLVITRVRKERQLDREAASPRPKSRSTSACARSKVTPASRGAVDQARAAVRARAPLHGAPDPRRLRDLRREARQLPRRGARDLHPQRA